jgi:hypothetical protein
MVKTFALGPVSTFDPIYDRSQQIFPTIGLNVSPDWELNFGGCRRDELQRSPGRKVHSGTRIQLAARPNAAGSQN